MKNSNTELLNQFLENTNENFNATQFKDVLLLSDFNALTKTIADANFTINNLDAINMTFIKNTSKYINPDFIANNNTFGLFLSDYLYINNQTFGFDLLTLSRSIIYFFRSFILCTFRHRVFNQFHLMADCIHQGSTYVELYE